MSELRRFQNARYKDKNYTFCNLIFSKCSKFCLFVCCDFRASNIHTSTQPIFVSPLDRRLGGTQDQSGRVRKILSPTGFNPRTVRPVASHSWPNMRMIMELVAMILTGKSKHLEKTLC